MICLSFYSFSYSQDQEEEPWSYTFNSGASLNWGFADKSSGLNDGHSISFLGKLSFLPVYKEEKITWENEFSLSEGFSKDPSSSFFSKSSDELKMASEFRYEFWEKQRIGFYSKTSGNTSILPGVLNFDKSSTLVIDGETSEEKISEIQMTSPFGMIQLTEILGGYWKFFKEENFELDFVLEALVAKQSFLDNQKIIEEQTTDLVKTKTLESFYQLGSGVLIHGKGSFYKEKIGYNLSAEFVSPWWQSKKSDKSFLNSMIINFSTQINFKLYESLKLSWELQAKKIPEILEEFQISHNLMFNFSYTF